DLINHAVDKLEVEFDFMANGAAYRVLRTVSLRGASTREAFRLIWERGQGEPHVEPELQTDSDEGFRAWIQKTIGLTYEAFTSSIVLLQGHSERLLQVEPVKRYEI